MSETIALFVPNNIPAQHCGNLSFFYNTDKMTFTNKPPDNICHLVSLLLYKTEWPLFEL